MSETQNTAPELSPVEFEHKRLERENTRLEELALRQNEELKKLNASLEEKVKAHAEEIRQTLEAVHAKVRQVEEEQGRQMNALADANVRMVLYHGSIERMREADVGLMGASLDVEGFCKDFLCNAMALIGAEYGAAGVFDSGGELRRFFTEGIGEEEQQKIDALLCGRRLLQAFYQEGKMVRVDNIAADQRSRGFPSGHPPMKSLLGVPLMCAGVMRGMIYLADKDGGEPFTDNDEILMDMMAMEAGHILDRHVLLVELRAINEMLEKERERQQMLNTQLSETQGQLLQSEKMASIGQLAAGVAHEINNPIGFVYSNLGSLEKYLKDVFSVLEGYEQAQGDAVKLAEVEVLKKKVDMSYLKEDVPALMNESKDGISRVKKIVQNLKDFSHADTSDEPQWANLHTGIDSTLNIVWNEIKYKAEVNKAYGDIPDIQCLPSELNQVFMNMLVNAAHAIEERGVISIRTGQEGDQVWVEIADSGKGIEEANIKRIFDPFFTTKPVGKGTGLGLSLSYSIVQKHHGRIDVSSEVGKGTVFRIWLPIRQEGNGKAGK
jgi:two-component system NtrC family sensor kinase